MPEVEGRDMDFAAIIDAFGAGNGHAFEMAFPVAAFEGMPCLSYGEFMVDFDSAAFADRARLAVVMGDRPCLRRNANGQQHYRNHAIPTN